MVYYFDFFMFFVPWSVSYLAFLNKWMDSKFQIDRVSCFFLILSVCISFALGGFMIWARSIYAGISIIVWLFFFYYFHFIYYIFIKNNRSLPRIWMIASGTIIALVCLISLIAAALSDGFNDFLGFSITWLTINIILLVYGYTLIQRDINNKMNEPLFFSPWIFPIYKLSKGHIIDNSYPTIVFLSGCLMFLIWSVSVSIWVYPVVVGICLTCLTELIVFMALVFIMTFTPY